MENAKPVGPPLIPLEGRQCTAKSKRSGQRCKRVASPGGTVCAMHGGKTPRGMASPHTVHGRYSKHLKGGILKTYRETIADPEILALDSEIALLAGRLADLLERIAGGGPGPRELAAAWAELDRARQSKDAQGFNRAFARMDALVASGHNTDALWQDVERCTIRLARLVRVESQRRVAMSAVLPTSKALEFAKSIVVSVLNHVHDPAIRARIQTDVRLALGDERIGVEC